MITAAQRSAKALVGWEKWRERSRAGNRCGHDPRKPRLHLASGTLKTQGKKFPWLIAEFLQRCEQLYNDRALLRRPGEVLGARKRSERIEAMVLVARAIGRTTDRLTLRSGHLNDDGTVTGYTAETLAKWTGMEVQRTYRALWDLRDAGFLTLSQPIEERPNGDRRGLAGIRNLTKEFFARLGLGGRLKRERQQLAKEARAVRTQQTIAQRRQLRRLFRQSARAKLLTDRTRNQLAEKATPAPAKVNSLAEMAVRLAEWSKRQDR